MRKSFLSAAVAAALLVPGLAAAQAASPITGNMSLVSDYRFRGLTQTFEEPALQGGFDYAHSSGIYVGNWNSAISDNFFAGSPLEMDFYGGYKGAVGPLGYDVGVLYYYLFPCREGQLVTRATAVATTVVWSGVVAFIAYKLIDLTIGLRVTEEDEREGLDTAAHGEAAYRI